LVQQAEGSESSFRIQARMSVPKMATSAIANTPGGLMVQKLNKWDSAQHLKTEEDIVAYFEACLEEAGDDASFIAKALGNIAKARGMTQLAKDTGLGRESLYKALSGEGNPSFDTILKVTHALGLQFRAAALNT
jgi:probable addiction module antidote protein